MTFVRGPQKFGGRCESLCIKERSTSRLSLCAGTGDGAGLLAAPSPPSPHCGLSPGGAPGESGQAGGNVLTTFSRAGRLSRLSTSSMSWRSLKVSSTETCGLDIV